MPLCNLDLILTGTISGTFKTAMISVDGREQQAFTIHQEITEGVFLVDVDARDAVVRHRDRLEKLRILSDSKNDEPMRIVTDPDPAVIVSVPPVAPESLDRLTARESKSQAPDESSDKKYSFMGIHFNFSDFFSDARIAPDATGGLRITESVPGGLYERLGLQDDDNLRAINEETVDSIRELTDIFKQEDGSEPIVVSIMRNSNLYDLEFDPKHGIGFRMIVEPKAPE